MAKDYSRHFLKPLLAVRCFSEYYVCFLVFLPSNSYKFNKVLTVNIRFLSSIYSYLQPNDKNYEKPMIKDED